MPNSLDPDFLLLGTHSIPRGKSDQVHIEVARLPSRTPIKITVQVNRAEKPGPVVLFLAGVHGDEINGVETIRRMIKAHEMTPECGTIISIPLLNVYGFINYSRSMPDGKDINRSFPGSSTGSLASRVAYQLMQQIIPLIDYGLDFHTGGANRANYPQIRCAFRDPNSVELAKAIEPPYIINSPYRDKSLRKASYIKGKTMLVFEGGEALRFSEHAIEEGRNCALRMLKFLGMRSEAPEPKDKTVVLKGSSWVRAKNSGLFVTNLPLGAEAKKNQRVGNIKGPYGDFDLSLKAPSAGFVIGLNNNPVVNMGDAVMHIGLLNNEAETTPAAE